MLLCRVPRKLRWDYQVFKQHSKFENKYFVVFIYTRISVKLYKEQYWCFNENSSEV